MLKSYLISSVRNIKRNAVSSMVSIGSIVLGIICTLAIYQYTYFERSFDQHIPDLDQKYRMTFQIYNNGQLSINDAECPAPAIAHFAENLSRIKRYTRYVQLRGSLLSNGSDQSIQTDLVGLSDAGLIDFFGVPWINGDDLFNDLNSAAISKSTAMALFGKIDVIGSYVTLDGGKQFFIKGIFDDFPPNSTVRLDFIAPLDYMQEIRPSFYQNGQNWGGYSFASYFEIEKESDITHLKEEFNRLYQERNQLDPQNLPEEHFNFEAMPVDEIHLHSKLSGEPTYITDHRKIMMLEILAIIILAIAWINFANIQLARTPERIKEIRLRQSLGASKSELRLLLIIEFLIINVTALVFGTLLTNMAVPYFLSNLQSDIWSLQFLPTYLWLIILIGISITSIIPAQISLRLKQAGLVSKNHSSSWLRNGLVTFQFAISLGLIAYTWVIYRQVQYMSNLHPGFETDQVMIINGPFLRGTDIHSKATYFKNEIRRYAGVQAVSNASLAPGRTEGWEGNMPSLEEERVFQKCKMTNIMPDFFQVFDVKIIAGRIPDFDIEAELPRVILNRTAVSGYGWSPEEAVGKRVGYSSGATVVAVVEDFNILGFQRALQPAVFIIDHVFFTHTTYDHFLVRIAPEQATNITQEITSLYRTVFPESPVDIQFASDSFASQYEAERQYSFLFSNFSMLAVLLAIAGLSGITMYNAIRKRKEIAIRKVLGISVNGILSLFLSKYIKLLSIASVLVAPLAYWLIQNWLTSFANRLSLGIDTLLIPMSSLGILVVAIVGGIVYQTVDSNPADVLKEL